MRIEGRGPDAASPDLTLAVGRRRICIHCDAGAAPGLLAALLALLPTRVDLHCPKIAGHHIYWPAPVLYQPEATSEVRTLRPGAFVFWPERQLVEITYAPLQAESAAVCRLGEVIEDLPRLAALGEYVRKSQGRQACFATLSQRDPPPSPGSAPVSPLPALARARALLWAECPAELSALLAARGVLRPAGPIFFAESETRLLHEGLWWLRTRLATDPALYPAAQLACEKAAARLRDFCQLEASAGLLDQAAQHLGPGRAMAAVALDEAILIAGRLAGWLDLLIPWEAVNRAVQRAGRRPLRRSGRSAGTMVEEVMGCP